MKYKLIEIFGGFVIQRELEGEYRLFDYEDEGWSYKLNSWNLMEDKAVAENLINCFEADLKDDEASIAYWENVDASVGGQL